MVDAILSVFEQPVILLSPNARPLRGNAHLHAVLEQDAETSPDVWWGQVSPNLPKLEEWTPSEDFYTVELMDQAGQRMYWQATAHVWKVGEGRYYALLCHPEPDIAPPLITWQHTVQGLQQHQQQLEDEIAERERVEQQLRDTQNQLETALEAERELNELKTRFIATASHEFRTPLSSILSSASLIERYPTTEQQDKRLKHVQRIQSSVRNLTQILEDFLSLSALEEGDLHQHRQPVDIPELVEGVLESVKNLAKQGQVLTYTHQGERPVLAINAQSLQNILLNLLSNAIKYSPKGAAIEVVSGWQPAPQSQLYLKVVDQGVGIPEAQQKHLFTRFFRADNVTAVQGTGLGLYIVKKYVEGMGGNIDLESKLGEGTSVFIHIPIQSDNVLNLSHRR